MRGDFICQTSATTPTAAGLLFDRLEFAIQKFNLLLLFVGMHVTYIVLFKFPLAKFMLLRDSAKVQNVFQQEYLWYADFKEADGKTAIGKERSKKTE